ncbi:hypothetical protein D8Z79_025875 (plasmid) [Escherichia fergusonii]|nr:hypothetical protein D8Z79_025650 [Escherichia fergusonii]QCZ35073.1 hypothetical protein D8Z79_025875 [Escherichia fergusonii]
MPSDIGFSNDRYILPELITNKHIVKNKSLIAVNGQIEMFNIVAKNFSEIRHEEKQTIQERSEKAVELAKEKVSVYWVNRNEESALINELDSDAVEIRGSMSIDKKRIF